MCCLPVRSAQVVERAELAIALLAYHRGRAGYARIRASAGSFSSASSESRRTGIQRKLASGRRGTSASAASQEPAPDEVAAIIEHEIQERRDAATTYAALGRHDEAAALRLQIEVLLAL